MIGKTIIIVFIMGVSILAFGAGDGGTQWTLKKAVKLKVKFGSVGMDGISLSPEGRRLAFVNNDSRALNIYALSDETLKSYVLPENFKGPVEYLDWSPSERYIAFSEDVFHYLNDPDIWIFDTGTGTFSDLTDDGTTDAILSAAESVSVDYLPVWDKKSDMIYYLHTSLRDGDKTVRTQEIYSIVPGKKPVKKADLTKYIPGFSVISPPVMSDNGKFIAMISFYKNPDEASNGVWILNLDDDAFSQVATMTSLFNSLPRGFTGDTSSYIPTDIGWASHDKGLIIAMINHGYMSVIPELYSYIDISARKVVPLIDISGIRSPGDLVKMDERGRSNFYRIMRQCILTSDGGNLIFFHYDQPREKISVSSMPLPPTGKKPVLLGEIDFELSGYRLRKNIVRAAKNGCALSIRFPYLIEFKAE